MISKFNKGYYSYFEGFYWLAKIKYIPIFLEASFFGVLKAPLKFKNILKHTFLYLNDLIQIQVPGYS